MDLPASRRVATARRGFAAAFVLAATFLSFDPVMAADPPPSDEQSVQLTEAQTKAIKVDTVPTHVFPMEDEAIGNIDFDEDLAVQVFTPYQGRIVQLYAKVGDDVTAGQLLFTIDSPDLIAAESNLIQAAGVLKLTTKALDRAKQLFAVNGIAQKDLDQATSDQQTAEGNLKAARDTVRIFGKTPDEIDRLIASRLIDPLLSVRSPVAGRVTARAAQPGLFVQPGSTPAPFVVADLSTMWMLANVPEAQIGRYRLGQAVSVKVPAYPDKTFEGQIVTIGSTVDPNSRRTFLRSTIPDPDHILRSGMFASFKIQTGAPETSLAMPFEGIVREGDGTMTAWVTTDGKKFVKRTVKLGRDRDGYHQILDGLKAGEKVVVFGALFLSNALAGVSSD